MLSFVPFPTLPLLYSVLVSWHAENGSQVAIKLVLASLGGKISIYEREKGKKKLFRSTILRSADLEYRTFLILASRV